QDKHYTIIPRIRRQIVFATHDVARNPPFINNDLVSCRNMLIYMNPVLQQKVISVLLFSLRKNGYLFLGPSETSTVGKDSLSELSSKWKIYKKTKDTRIGSQFLANMSEHRMTDADKTSWLEPERKPRQLWDAFRQLLTDDVRMAAFYIDQNFEIKETIGNYEKILVLPKKLLKLNLLRMVPSELYFVLNTEIKKSWQDGRKRSLSNLHYKRDREVVSWQVVIQPLQPYTLVAITETAVPEHTPQTSLPAPSIGQNEYIMQLEAELLEARNSLQQATEDQETVNEELQSTNEELLSSNEELQSSNEELQSLNEELHTLNTEHQLKIKELTELNNDLNNYFRSTDIAQVFLDRDLNIRKFNTASMRMINFIDADIGRPIAHISNNIHYEHFMRDVEQVLRHGNTVEREVQLHNGMDVLMRIMPYLTRENQSTGVIISFVDITALTSLNNIIRSVLNSNPSAILAFRAVREEKGQISDFILQMANHAAVHLLDKGVLESIGASLRKQIPLLNTGHLFEQYVQVVQTGRPVHSDMQLGDDGRWYSMGLVRMQDGFVGTFTDITEKKLAEEKIKKNYTELIRVKDNLKRSNEQLENKVKERTRALAASEERFRLVARATNDALWDWDFVNNSVWWSEAFYKIFGYDTPSQHGDRKFWLEKVHPDDRESVNESLYEVINSRKNQWSREYRFQKQNGEYANILDRGYVIHDEFGTPYRMLGSMFDVTPIKTAEQRVASNIAQRKFLAESMPLIVWTVDPRGQVDFVNKQFETYTGKHYREALGNNWQSFIHREDLHTLRDHWATALKDKNDFAVEVRICNAAGEYQWNLLRAKARKDKDGRLLNIVITITDIHHQKVMNEVLENMVAERTRELKDINDALEISNNDLQQFASVASHDLQEPLRKIQMFTGIIRDRFINELSDVPRQYLDKIMVSSARMKVLITDILSYSRLSASDSNFEPTNLRKIIDETLDDFEILIKEKNATIDIGELPVVEIIGGQMRQVFQNLLSNALKFTRSEVAPHISIQGQRVSQRAFDAPEHPEGEWSRITVKDNGIGFDKQFASHIFNLFQRLHSKDKYEGSGIGLAITKKIIDKHGGIITAHSEEGKGATFVIVLPVKHRG
ncbi:MAG: PAS domain-containing protein, partial [Bacteroidetes bacterium]|nr:PAS domain-containing protein [Bacteroidota bacterium]